MTSHHRAVPVSARTDTVSCVADDPQGPSDGDDDEHEGHRRAYEKDMAAARETLERVRMEMPFRKALWGFRVYYIGVFSSIGSLLVSCFDGSQSPMLVIPVMLPPGVAGYVYGYLQLRDELRDFLAAASTEVWHARRDRKNLWQLAILRDSFMGRLHG